MGRTETVMPETPLRTEQFMYEFMGKVLAAFSHEIQNHIATIHEIAGIQGDMIARGRSLDDKQIGRYLTMTNRHVGSSLRLIGFLNRYAHRLDEEIASFSVNDVLEELLALTGRLFRQKGITVQTAFHGGPCEIRSRALFLQSLVFAILERKINSFAEEGTIIVRTDSPVKGEVRIDIDFTGIIEDGRGEPCPIEDAAITSLADLLSVTLAMTADGRRVSLHVPSQDRQA
ncbi:MAG TPA: hypothetical protein VN260_04765 [Dissulfurispiraceae bacterium]|nr:hypothetical protein [Dissulfurispiraceae bacterium]